MASVAATNTGTGNIAYTGTGNLNLNAISNGNRDVALTTSNGAITQSGAMTAGHVTASAATGINLSNSGTNIVDLSASNTGNGDITVKSYGNQSFKIDDVGTVSGNISITNDHNDVALYGNLTTALTTGNSVTLISGTGVVQNGGNITANHLDAQTGSDIDFGSTGNDVRNFTASSGNGHISLTDTGALTTGDVMAGAGKYITLTTAGNLTTSGQINGGAISLTSTGGDIALNGGVRGSGAATINAHGAITQTAYVAAASLNAMAGTGITLNDAANSVAGFSANNSNSGDISFTNHHGSVLTLGTINNGARNVTVSTDSNMLQDGNGITAGTLNVSASGGINLNGDNHVSTFIASNPLGNIDFINTGNLTVQTVSAAAGSVNISTTGTLTVDTGATVTAQAITLASSSGVVTESEGGDTQAPPQSDADMTINGRLIASGQDGVALSSDGKITQAAGAAGISTTALDVNSSNGATLSSSANNIGELTALNRDTGDVVVNSASTELLLDGNVNNQATGGNVSITNTGKITAVSHIAGGPPVITNGITADNKVTLITTGAGGDVTLGKIVAHDLDVSSEQGKITSVMDNISLQIAGTMTATAKTGILLAGNSNATFINHLGTFNASNTDSGDITLNNHDTGEDVLTLGQISNVNGNVIISNNRAVVQSSDAGTKINALGLNVTADGGITLNSANNTLNAFTASNTGSGDIALLNNSAVTTAKILTTGAITNSNGNISVENTGRMDVNGAVNAPQGSVSLVTHSPLNINGTVNANGNINFAAGSTSSGSIVDNLIVNGAVTSATGNVVATAGNVVTLNSAINAPQGVVNITAYQIVINDPQPVPPNFTPIPAPPDGNPILINTPAPPVVIPPNSDVDQNVHTTTDDPSGNSSTLIPTLNSTNSASSGSNNGNQTAGGGDGEFGGSKDDGKGDKNAKAPVCS